MASPVPKAVPSYHARTKLRLIAPSHSDFSMTALRHLGVLQRPDCRLYYEVSGEGPAIVFAHGLGGNHMSWFQQVAHFAAQYTCVAFAHRGFAPSSPVAGGPNPADFAADLAALVAHLGLNDIRIVAQSMGGWTAVEYALQQPPGLKALVLASTTGTVDPQKIIEPEHSRLALWADTAMSRIPELIARGVPLGAGEGMASDQPAQHLLYRQIDDLNSTLDKEALRARLGKARTRAPDELNRIACPILFVSGDEDVVIPPFAADAIARVVPSAKVVHIADAGHSAYFERPTPFNQIVEEFLANL